MHKDKLEQSIYLSIYVSIYIQFYSIFGQILHSTLQLQWLFIQKPKTAAANCPAIESCVSCWAVVSVFYVHSTYCCAREKLDMLGRCMELLASVKRLIIFILDNASLFDIKNKQTRFFCAVEKLYYWNSCPLRIGKVHVTLVTLTDSVQVLLHLLQL